MARHVSGLVCRYLAALCERGISRLSLWRETMRHTREFSKSVGTLGAKHRARCLVKSVVSDLAQRLRLVSLRPSHRRWQHRGESRIGTELSPHQPPRWGSVFDHLLGG